MLKRVKLFVLVVKQEMELNDAKLSYNVLPYKQFGVSTTWMLAKSSTLILLMR